MLHFKSGPIFTGSGSNRYAFLFCGKFISGISDPILTSSDTQIKDNKICLAILYFIQYHIPRKIELQGTFCGIEVRIRVTKICYLARNATLNVTLLSTRYDLGYATHTDID